MAYNPSSLLSGGITASSSLLKTANICEQLLFLEYVAPHPDHPNSQGLSPYIASDNLHFGTLWHAAMEGYRLTGWKDGADSGEYNAEATIVHIQATAQELLPQFESQPLMEETRDAVVALFRKWLAVRDITNEWKVAAVPGTDLPMLEHELAINIAGFTYTVKVDVGLFAPEGYFQIGEYKTSQAQWLHLAQREAQMSIQARGEALALYSHYSHLPLRGVRFMYAVKNRAAKSDLPQFPDLELDYDSLQLDTFQQNVERWMFSITSKVESYQRLLSNTNISALEAGRIVFPMSGMAAGTCWRYNRPCQFFDYCESGGNPANIHKERLAPRLVDGIPFEREHGTVPLMDDPSQL